MKRILWAMVLGLCGASGLATRIQGTVRYEDFTIGLSGFTEATFRPVRRVEVAVVNIDGGNQVIATTVTNQQGRFDVEAASAGTGTRIGVNVLARTDALEVVDNLQQTYLWTTTSSPLTINSDPFDLGVLNIREADNAGALNIVDVITVGHDYVAERSAKSIPSVRVVWKKNLVTRCGTCYSNSEINLLNSGSSRNDDTDEYDDSVILHEYGHHIQDHVSCSESPGGSHGPCDSQQHPALAWSEGSAQYFSVVVAGLDPRIDQVPGIYLDTAGSLAAGSQIIVRDNLEQNDLCQPPIYGSRSETTVSRVLWDLQDAAEDGPDRYQRSEREIFALIDAMQGDPACDLRTFVGGLCSQIPAEVSGYAPIFSAFNVAVQPPCPGFPRRRPVRR